MLVRFRTQILSQYGGAVFPLFDMAMHRLSQKYGKPLPYYFSMDVNAMDLPLVCIYLDTYEKMVSRAEGAGDSTGFTQEWLRVASGLLPNLGNAVFAIAGRERQLHFVCERLYEAFKKQLGPLHPSTLKAGRNVVNILVGTINKRQMVQQALKGHKDSDVYQIINQMPDGVTFDFILPDLFEEPDELIRRCGVFIGLCGILYASVNQEIRSGEEGVFGDRRGYLEKLFQACASSGIRQGRKRDPVAGVPCPGVQADTG